MAVSKLKGIKKIKFQSENVALIRKPQKAFKPRKSYHVGNC